MTLALPSTSIAPGAAPAASATGTPVAANPLTAPASSTSTGTVADVARFLQALQRAGTAAALAVGNAAGPAVFTANGEHATEDADGSAEAAEAAQPLPALWMAAPTAATPPATPAAMSASSADTATLAGQDSAAPVTGAAVSLAALTLPAAPTVANAVPASVTAQPAGLPAQAFAATSQAADTNAAPTDAALASRAHPAAVAAEALTGGSALSPEAAAVRERSTAANAGQRAANDAAAAMAANTLSNEAPALHAPAHAAGTAARLPSALVDALGERIETQLQRGSERTVIRLDPPMQGQLEITIRREAGAIQVHLSATSADVVKQLQAISDSLRQDLGARQGGDVSVVVSQHTARDGDGRGRHAAPAPEQAEPGRALAEAEEGQALARFALSTPTY